MEVEHSESFQKRKNEDFWQEYIPEVKPLRKNKNIHVYNKDDTYSIKSPVIPDLISDEEEYSVKISSASESKYMIYESVVSSPAIVGSRHISDFDRKMGRMNKIPPSPLCNSPKDDVLSMKSGRYSSRSRSIYSPVSIANGIDYERYYKTKTPPQVETNDVNSEILNLLREQIEENKKLTAELMKQKTTSSRSRVKTSIKIPIDEESEEEEKKDLIDYENLSDEEVALLEAKLAEHFQKLANLYPRHGIEIPEIGVISLRAAHEIYEDYVEDIKLYQFAMKLKVYLMIALILAEYYFYECQKIRAFKHFAKVQIKSINRWNVYLVNFAQTFKGSRKSGSGEEYPNWMNFAFSLFTSIFSHLGMNLAANSFGRSAPERALHAAGLFISPINENVKFKSDGISDVPLPPTDWQDPEYITKNGPGLYQTMMDFKNGKLFDNNEEPVKAKPVPAGKYDDVFD